MRKAASLVKARKPVWASLIGKPVTFLVTHVASLFPNFFPMGMWSNSSICRSPNTISAISLNIGSINFGISLPLYWPSASMFTIISAFLSNAISNPVLNACASPLFCLNEMILSAPAFSASLTVVSVEPSSTTNISTASRGAISRGISLITPAIVSSSLYAGMVMMSFMWYTYI